MNIFQKWFPWAYEEDAKEKKARLEKEELERKKNNRQKAIESYSVGRSRSSSSFSNSGDTRNYDATSPFTNYLYLDSSSPVSRHEVQIDKPRVSEDNTPRYQSYDSSPSRCDTSDYSRSDTSTDSYSDSSSSDSSSSCSSD